MTKRVFVAVAAISVVGVLFGADWVGGTDNNDATKSANWNPSSASLTDGTTLGAFSSGSTARLPSAGSLSLQGINLSVANFALAADDATGLLTLGAAGLTNSAAGVTCTWPMSLAANQIWYTASGATLEMHGALSGSKNLTFYGNGTVNWYGTNTCSGTVYVGTNNSGEKSLAFVRLYPGARLTTGTISVGTRNGYGLELCGVTIPGNVIAGTANTAAAPGGLYVAENTDNTIVGSLSTQYANASMSGIKGHLTVQGGVTATTIANAQGAWYPFGSWDGYACGSLTIETKPLTANRLIMPRGTLELAAAGNKVVTRGLYLSGSGLLKTSAAEAFKATDANKLKMTGGTWDLCGNDQSLSLFCGLGGTVTSTGSAQLHVDNSTYFFDSKFKNDVPDSSPALGLGTNVTVCSTIFTGAAGLSKEGSLDLNLAGASTSTGELTLKQGTLTISAADASATYTGTTIAKTQGSWAGSVKVTAGTLVVEHSAAFGTGTDLYISGGSVTLPATGTMVLHRICVTDGNDGWTEYRGSVGGPDSSATYKPQLPGGAYVFSGGAVIYADPDTEASWTQAGADSNVRTMANWNPQTIELDNGSLTATFAAGTTAQVGADDTVAFNGLAISQPNFTFSALTGAKVRVGAAGLVNTAAGVTYGWPTDFGSTAQSITTPSAASMNVTAPLTGTGTTTFAGAGTLTITSTNNLKGLTIVGTATGGNSAAAHVTLAKGASLGTGALEICCPCWSGLTLEGVTLSNNLTIATQNANNPSSLFIKEGTTNILEGKYTSVWRNRHSIDIGGTFIVRGGMDLQFNWGRNNGGGFLGWNNHSGTLRVEEKPLVSRRFNLPRGALELAAEGNRFAEAGLVISGGTLRFDTDNPFIETPATSRSAIQMSAGTIDLNGHSPRFHNLLIEGGVVTGLEGDQLVWADDSEWAMTSLECFTFVGKGRVNRAVFTGAAGLKKEGTLPHYLAARSTSTGKLTVAAGTLTISAADATATYPETSIAKTEGAWAGSVEVTGGTLVIEHGAALSNTSDIYVTDGSVTLPDEGAVTAHRVYVTDGNGGWTEYSGSIGGPDSTAAFKPQLPGGAYVFSGRARIFAGMQDAASWTQEGTDDDVRTVQNWNPQSVETETGSLCATFAAGTSANIVAGTAAFKSLTIAQDNFQFTSVAGTQATLGSGGLTNTASGVSYGWATDFGGSALAWISPLATSSLTVTAPISGSGNWLIRGLGTVTFGGTNDFSGTLTIGGSNSDASGYAKVTLLPGAKLAGAGAIVKAQNRYGYGLTLMGNTLDHNLVVGTENTTGPSGLFIPAGTTSILNGSYTTTYLNRHSIDIAGTFIVRGGMYPQAGGRNVEGGFRAWEAHDGTLRVEDLPYAATRTDLPRGRFELATSGNKFNGAGLVIYGGTLMLDADDAIFSDGSAANESVIQMSAGTIDLNGHDLRLAYYKATGGTVTSARAATFHLADNAEWSMADKEKWSFASTGLVDHAVYAGCVSLAKEGALSHTLSMVSSSTGTLSVAAGRLVMSTYDKNATYAGTDIAKTYGAWPNAARVEVTGGTLAVEHSHPFGVKTTLAVSGAGQVELAADAFAQVGALTVDGVTLTRGVYGGKDSTAKNKPKKENGDYVFTGTGKLTVGNTGLALMLHGEQTAEVGPKLRFGVLSDIHITARGSGDTPNYTYGNAQTFVHALKYFKEQNVDAIVIAGDMADRGLPENLTVVANAWKEVFPDNTAADGRHVEKVFIYGNHDADADWFDNSSGQIKSGMTADEIAALKARSISRNRESCWADAWGETYEPIYMKTVKGYKFVAAHWGCQDQTPAFLDEHVFDLIGDKPFFFIQHPQPKGSIYGNYLRDADSGVSAAALAQYPNAIAFSGHSHRSIATDGGICQKDFTSIGTSTLSYLGHFGSGLNAISQQSREGMLISVYADRVDIVRREFVQDAEIGPAWSIPLPIASSAKPYAYENIQQNLAAPEYETGAELVVARTAEGLSITCPTPVFDATHARTHWHRLTIRRENVTLYSGLINQELYFRPFDQIPAATTYVLPTSAFSDTGSFTVEIRARDFFDRESAPLATIVPAE